METGISFGAKLLVSVLGARKPSDGGCGAPSGETGHAAEAGDMSTGEGRGEEDAADKDAGGEST